MMNLKYNIPVVLKDVPDDSFRFQPLPIPTGEYPYRLNIKQVLEDKTDLIRNRMAFHMVGDTGSARHSEFQALVASSIAKQLGEDSRAENNPAFLYHLGDIVYNHGEAHEYPSQFLKPYENYNAPIFAIPGNHDGDINPDSRVSYQSLDAFTEVFCNEYRQPLALGEGSKRLSMIQPNVYWTLETPLARFIGLYANVNRHGIISEEQKAWFIEELKYAEQYREQQALIVCLHQAPYSADINHGSSAAMISFLESSFRISCVRPDIVFSGHVHNYQRFSKTYDDGTIIPYIVAGAGGYADLHPLAHTYDKRVEALPLDHQVRLEAFCDNCFGFLKVDVEKVPEGLSLTVEYYTLPQHITESGDRSARLYDRFVVPLKYQTLHTSQIPSYTME
jgi:hypothetical protein